MERRSEVRNVRQASAPHRPEEALMNPIIDLLRENFLWFMLGLCFVVGAVVKGITAICTTSARERSRREIAAYIAEGSMTPDQGERLIRADVNRGPSRHA
jgi:hypothetical protein